MESASFREQLSAIEIHERLAFVVQSRVQKIEQSGKCPGCWLQPRNCLCADWKQVTSDTKVVVHIHHAEW